MPIKIYKCNFCDFIDKHKTKVKKHEKNCKGKNVCIRCKHLSFWWGSYSCMSRKSSYGNGDIIISDVIHSHSCEFWKKKNEKIVAF